MSLTDLYGYDGRFLPKGHVLVTTNLDIICPSVTQRGSMQYRCRRGVGHEGDCRFNNRVTWRISPHFKALAQEMLRAIVAEQEGGVRATSGGSRRRGGP